MMSNHVAVCPVYSDKTGRTGTYSNISVYKPLKKGITTGLETYQTAKELTQINRIRQQITMAKYKEGPAKLKTHYFPALYPIRVR